MSGRHLTRVLMIAGTTMMASTAHAQTATLDGKAFVADAGEKGKAADEKNDVITFAGGKFHSSACDQYGFTKGEYKASATLRFERSMPSFVPRVMCHAAKAWHESLVAGLSMMH